MHIFKVNLAVLDCKQPAGGQTQAALRAQVKAALAIRAVNALGSSIEHNV